MLRITTRDIGATQAATLHLGETEVIQFRTHTRHAERSREIATEKLASLLRELLVGEGYIARDDVYTDIEEDPFPEPPRPACTGDPCTCTNGIGCTTVPYELW